MSMGFLLGDDENSKPGRGDVCVNVIESIGLYASTG